MKTEARKITSDCQPVFPCWLWTAPFAWDVQAGRLGEWSHWNSAPTNYHNITHWHPDQPTPPTMNPTEQREDAFQEARSELRTIAQQVESERGLRAPRPCLPDEQVAQRAPAVCEDTRMLDYMQKNGVGVSVGQICKNGVFWFHVGTNDGHYYIRDAIRIAMAQGEGK